MEVIEMVKTLSEFWNEVASICYDSSDYGIIAQVRSQFRTNEINNRRRFALHVRDFLQGRQKAFFQKEKTEKRQQSRQEKGQKFLPFSVSFSFSHCPLPPSAMI